jgi:hypothetical protein
MLRLRKKPPEGLPTINAGTAWSEMDLADLREMARDRSAKDIADYLCRELEEVEAKLSLLPAMRQSFAAVR